jgi:arabinose-5-phosphate isomerase
MANTGFIQSALRTIDIEARSVAHLQKLLDDNFVKALGCDGRVVVTGMGKSGHIANKLAATLASTGTPAFFVHPGEASHGDMGMITRRDVVLALSNSGTTHEILTILPLIKRMNAPLISMTGVPDSILAEESNAHLNTAVEEEACPLGLAPTSSSTAALVMGDALAIALLEARGFSAEDFAFSHPGGALGRRLLLKVDDVMVCGSQIPKVHPDTPLKHALVEMTAKSLGMTTVVDGDGKAMTPVGKICEPGILAAEALRIMEDNDITTLPVVRADHSIAGILSLHDLIKAGLA